MISSSLARSTLSPIALQVGETDMMRGRQNGEQVAAVVAQHDGLGEAVARDVAGLGGARRRHCGVVRDTS